LKKTITFYKSNWLLNLSYSALEGTSLLMETPKDGLSAFSRFIL